MQYTGQRLRLAVSQVARRAAGVGAILGDEMGLGKTLQSIAYLRAVCQIVLEGGSVVFTLV